MVIFLSFESTDNKEDKIKKSAIFAPEIGLILYCFLWALLSTSAGGSGAGDEGFL